MNRKGDKALIVGLDIGTSKVTALVGEYSPGSEIEVIGIGPAEGDLALDAFERYGKGRHPARLNMGDCFAYACARTHGVPLLFKGDDFSHTDILIA